jgi:hypothetical protein
MNQKRSRIGLDKRKVHTKKEEEKKKDEEEGKVLLQQNWC